MFVTEVFAAPVRFRQWRKAGRRWRRIFLLPPPEPGTEAAEQLAYWKRIRRQVEARSYPVRGGGRHRKAAG